MYKLIKVNASYHKESVDIPKGFKVITMAYRNVQSEIIYILLRKKVLGLF